MEDMIDQGADLIFATSYGHLEFAQNVAERNPDVVFVHQGGLEGEPRLDNLGTYFGTVYEPVYTAGIAAGSVTRDRASSATSTPSRSPRRWPTSTPSRWAPSRSNPDVEVITISTGSWCDPGIQAEAAQSLLDQDVDVITQHQDCTKTIIEATEAAGAFSVGYHADASELAPEGWITGSEWDWDPLYVDIVETVHGRRVRRQPLQRRLPGRPPDRRQPVHPVGVRPDGRPRRPSPSSTRPSSASSTVARPSQGPVLDQDGEELIAEGEQPTYEEIETMDFFVQGVVGTLG